MPNWVYNTVDSYSKDIHDKYKGEETEIDFNKIIPEPEEIKNTESSSNNKVGKQLYDYQQYKEKNADYKKSSKYNCGLYNEFRVHANYVENTLGELVIENPDKSLNTLLEDDKHQFEAMHYKNYVERYGKNVAFKNLSNEQFYDACDRYRDQMNNIFESGKQRSDIYKDYATIEDYGKRCYELKEKYGFDNWYDWRVANWGTKWNACDTEYDEESECLHFDTAWSVPEPILAKIAEDNPDANMDIYSEEETGWFIKSQIKDSKLYELGTGEYTWSENSDEPVMTENIYDEPKAVTFSQIREESIKDWAKFVDRLQ